MKRSITFPPELLIVKRKAGYKSQSYPFKLKHIYFQIIHTHTGRQHTHTHIEKDDLGKKSIKKI